MTSSQKGCRDAAISPIIESRHLWHSLAMRERQVTALPVAAMLLAVCLMQSLRGAAAGCQKLGSFDLKSSGSGSCTIDGARGQAFTNCLSKFDV